MGFVSILSTIPEHVTLIAVSKTQPVHAIEGIYSQGQRHFGENKVQELCEKQELLQKDIHWHLIGHLQTNKVKFIAPFVHMIHSVDSFRLLKEIDKEGKKHERIISCLLQFHIAEEETKFGFSFEEVKEILESADFIELRNVQICGIMGMASNTDNMQQVSDEFCELEGIFQILKSHYFKFNPNFKELSMGMSSDYGLAIEQGSTMVRIGSAIFGSR